MDNNKGGKCKNEQIVAGLMILSIVLITFLSYREILDYFFTAGDTLSLIDTSRIQSYRDISRIFTEPMMNGTQFTEIAKYYRPISTLSFSLDYSIWGLNAFGYHLTDLILHISVSVMVFFLMRFLTKDRLVIAWLAAIIFTAHPVLVEVVPGVARRQEVIVSLFLLLSLLFFLKYFTNGMKKNGYLVFSVFFYALALGAKEIAIILPLLVFAYQVISCLLDKKPLKNTIINALKGTLVYFVITFLFFTWRAYILQGINLPQRQSGTGLRMIIESYVGSLLYPVDFLGSLFGYLPYRTLLFVSIIIIIGIYQYEKIKKSMNLSYRKSVFFFLAWLLIPLGVYLMTSKFDYRYMYIPIIPFSGILSIMITEGITLTIQKIKERKYQPAGFCLSWINTTISSFIIAGLSFSLIAYSPLFRTYREWEDTGRMSSIFLHKVSEIASQLPDDGVIRIFNLPDYVSPPDAVNTHVKTAAYLAGYSVKSWLDLNFPSNHKKVIVNNQVNTYLNNLTLETRIVGDSSANITFIPRLAR
ncbi:MAG: hypothetical protein HZB61_06670 [Nitrospirae bacterium]|nr:hypothetical protein [Nitrospirota bacterium]